jgi:ATP-binding cassette subfamily F protein 3
VKVRALEAELAKLTAQRSAIDQALFDPKASEPGLAKLSATELMQRRSQLEKAIAEREAVWMEASEAIESIAA